MATNTPTNTPRNTSINAPIFLSKNILSSDLGQCIKGGNGKIINGVVITTRIYNNYGYSTNNYCISTNGIVNIPDGEMFYELIKSANTNVTAYDQPDGNGNQVQLIPPMVQSLLISVNQDGDSSSQLSTGAIIGIVIMVIIILALLSSGGYYGHKYYKKWRGRQSSPVSEYSEGDFQTNGGYQKIRF
jgi:hypothetical protein